MTIDRLTARLAKLEQRLDPTPDPRRMAEVRQRLVAAADAATDLDQILAFRAAIEASRRRAGAR